MNNDEECPSLLGTLEFLNFPDKMTEGFFEKISISHDSTQSSTSPTQESTLPTPPVTPNKIEADDLSSVSSQESKTSEKSNTSEKSDSSKESKLTSESSSESSSDSSL